MAFVTGLPATVETEGLIRLGTPGIAKGVRAVASVTAEAPAPEESRPHPAKSKRNSFILQVGAELQAALPLAIF
jgi:hypothetical protein